MLTLPLVTRVCYHPEQVGPMLVRNVRLTCAILDAGARLLAKRGPQHRCGPLNNSVVLQFLSFISLQTAASAANTRYARLWSQSLETGRGIDADPVILKPEEIQH